MGFRHQLLVALLKHGGIGAGGAVLMAVLVHLVDKEQGQYLDALLQIPQLLVQVGFDGAPDLRLLDDVLVHVANGLAQLDLLGVAELDMLKVGECSQFRRRCSPRTAPARRTAGTNRHPA